MIVGTPSDIKTEAAMPCNKYPVGTLCVGITRTHCGTLWYIVVHCGTLWYIVCGYYPHIMCQQYVQQCTHIVCVPKTMSPVINTHTMCQRNPCVTSQRDTKHQAKYKYKQSTWFDSFQRLQDARLDRRRGGEAEKRSRENNSRGVHLLHNNIFLSLCNLQVNDMKHIFVNSL